MTSAAARVDRWTLWTRVALVVIGVAAFVIFSVALANFLTVDNLVDLLNALALAGLVAVPATFLIMAGQVDLSVGGNAALVGVVLAALSGGVGLPVAVVVAVVAGLLIGLGNGLLVTAARVNGLAATFASAALVRGLAFLVSGGLAIELAGFGGLGDDLPASGVAVSTVIFGLVAVAGALLSRSAVGARSRDVGAPPAAVRFDGRPERRRVLALFVVSGLAAALVGLIRASQLGVGVPSAAIGLEIVVLTAVLLGGGGLAGGRGSVGGTLLALLVISIIDNGLSLANVSPYAPPVLFAALLIVALVLDHLSQRSRRRLVL